MRNEKNLRPKSDDRNPIYAKKSFGQNFLVDRNYVGKIIAALNPKEGETVIEIGAGRGALTGKLIESGANIIAVELERDMIFSLSEQFADKSNFKLVEADALKVDFQELTKTQNQTSKTKLVANLPYYISTAILQKLIAQRNVFGEMILMFQREVVERITARVGNSERGFLSVLVQTYLEVEKLFDVPPDAFRPAPKVWSSIVKLSPKDNISINDESLFRQLISGAFVQKRKTILNNFKHLQLKNLGEINWNRLLENVQIETNRRAESLTLEEWNDLFSEVEKTRK